MKKYFLHIVLIFLSGNLFGQQHFFKYPIYVDLNKQYIYSFNKVDSSIISDVSTSESKNFKLYNFDSLGKFRIIFYDSVKKEKTEGAYLIAKKIKKIKKYVIPVGAGGLTKRKVINFYFQNSIRIGTWITYNEQNVIKNKVQW